MQQRLPSQDWWLRRHLPGQSNTVIGHANQADMWGRALAPVRWLDSAQARQPNLVGCVLVRPSTKPAFQRIMPGCEAVRLPHNTPGLVRGRDEYATMPERTYWAGQDIMPRATRTAPSLDSRPALPPELETPPKACPSNTVFSTKENACVPVKPATGLPDAKTPAAETGGDAVKDGPDPATHENEGKPSPATKDFPWKWVAIASAALIGGYVLFSRK